MSESRLEAGEQSGWFCLRGELTFDTVAQLLASSQALLAASPALTIDLAGVQRSDSAGLALLIEWTRSAAARRQAIAFTNIPAQMRALARVSGLDGVLPFERLGP
jgi:phospholipid transport system transporter-binding protein